MTEKEAKEVARQVLRGLEFKVDAYQEHETAVARVLLEAANPPPPPWNIQKYICNVCTKPFQFDMLAGDCKGYCYTCYLKSVSSGWDERSLQYKREIEDLRGEISSLEYELEEEERAHDETRRKLAEYQKKLWEIAHTAAAEDS